MVNHWIFLDNSYGSIHTLADFNSSALNAISAFTGVDTATQRGMFGINGPLIPNVVGQSVTDIPFFSMWVEEHTLTSSQGVVNWHKRLRIRIYNRRLRRAGFEVAEVKVRARGASNRKGGSHHVVWIATPRVMDNNLEKKWTQSAGQD